MLRRYSLLFVCFLLIPFFSQSEVRKGILDISNQLNNRNRSISMSGSWQFYWQTTFQQYQQQTATSNTVFTKVPGKWVENGYPRKGYGLYVVKVILPRNSHPYLGMNIPSVGNAYRLYINGELKSKVGTFGTTKAESKPEYFPQSIYFNNTRDTIEIAIEVSNFYYREGGLGYSPSIGEASIIRNESNKN